MQQRRLQENHEVSGARVGCAAVRALTFEIVKLNFFLFLLSLSLPPRKNRKGWTPNGLEFLTCSQKREVADAYNQATFDWTPLMIIV